MRTWRPTRVSAYSRVIAGTAPSLPQSPAMALAVTHGRRLFFGVFIHGLDAQDVNGFKREEGDG